MCVVLYYGWWHGDRSLQVLKVSQQNGDRVMGFPCARWWTAFFLLCIFKQLMDKTWKMVHTGQRAVIINEGFYRKHKKPAREICVMPLTYVLSSPLLLLIAAAFVYFWTFLTFSIVSSHKCHASLLVSNLVSLSVSPGSGKCLRWV